MAAVDREEAFAYCERRARDRHEGLSFGIFGPREKRPYLAALYAFARAADDFTDEAIYEGMRLPKLDDWERLLRAAYRGEAEGPIFVALGETVRRFALPMELLLDLLSAFREDVEKGSYESWEELREHCRRSSGAIGRLVLLVFDQQEDTLPELSEAFCSGLQLAHHWRGVTLDSTRGRIYVPQDLLRRHGVASFELRAGRVSPGRRQLMEELVARTRELLACGRPLCDRVARDLRFELRLLWLGGMRILDQVERSGGEPVGRPPRQRLHDRAALAWQAWRWPAV